jgi:hypothetical protein
MIGFKRGLLRCLQSEPWFVVGENFGTGELEEHDECM